MAKDFAFMFYPGNWLGGTMGMSFEQKRCYLELLVMQFNTGKFTESEAKQLLSICFDHAWPTLKRKFNTDGTYYWNERLQVEMEKRLKYIESRRLSGLTPKKQKAHVKHTHKHTLSVSKDKDISCLNYAECLVNFKRVDSAEITIEGNMALREPDLYLIRETLEASNVSKLSARLSNVIAETYYHNKELEKKKAKRRVVKVKRS